MARTPDAALAAASDAPADTQARMFAWIFGAAGLCVLVCCGGGLSWANGVEKEDDPQRIREITAALITAEIPERFEPEQALGVPPPPIVGWFSDGRTDLVDYASKGGGRLILSRRTNDDADPAAVAAAAATDMGDPDMGAPDDPDGAGAGTGTGQVRTIVTRAGFDLPVAFGASPATAADMAPRPGDPEPVVKADGSTAPAGPIRRVFGAFRDGDVTYIVQISLPDREYDEAEIIAFLESLAPADE
ncbi:hypothetical protein LzC2_42190 [Planctomycetes bacterium LzC2]|uniref:Secreted protein n=1 Tax=Alienimonas chondri TaxID=2681879 RepID=A0ABX1VIZ8_9PLAN|nr:hypothetical protein [Alienimonas chondri]